MKQCPACKTTYTDDSLSYCLSDGTALSVVPDEDPTVIRDREKGGVRVDMPEAASDRTVVIGPEEPTQSKPSSLKWIAVVIIGLLLGVAALAALGLAGAAYFYSSAGNSSAPSYRTPTPRPTATPDTEKERLREELANVQKRLDEQKQTSNTSNPSPTDDFDDNMAVTGTVDSPGDGFLALRDYPDAERGNRLAKIPHGAEVEILNCEKKAVTVSGRSGRWCQVEYNGQNGWVFDAWLDY